MVLCFTFSRRYLGIRECTLGPIDSSVLLRAVSLFFQCRPETAPVTSGRSSSRRRRFVFGLACYTCSASSSLSQRPRFVFAFSIPFFSKVFESRLSVSAVCCRYRASLSELSFILPFPSIFSVFRPLLTWSASIPGLGFWSLSSCRIVINASIHDFSRLRSPVLRFSGISSSSFRFIPFRRLQPNHPCRSDCHIVLRSRVLAQCCVPAQWLYR